MLQQSMATQTSKPQLIKLHRLPEKGTAQLNPFPFQKYYGISGTIKENFTQTKMAENTKNYQPKRSNGSQKKKKKRETINQPTNQSYLRHLHAETE